MSDVTGKGASLEELVRQIIDEHIEVERRDTVDLETNQVVRVNVIKGSREAAARIMTALTTATAPSPEPQPSVRLDREEIRSIIAQHLPLICGHECGRKMGTIDEAEAYDACADAIISSARSGGE